MLLYNDDKFFTLSKMSTMFMKKALYNMQNYFRQRPVYYIHFSISSKVSFESRVSMYTSNLEMFTFQWHRFGIHRFIIIGRLQSPFRCSVYRLKPSIKDRIKFKVVINGQSIKIYPHIFMQEKKLILKLGSYLQPGYKQQGVDLSAS